MLLEVCANSLESALNAQEGGAKRIELCQDLRVGGLTPELDTMRQVREQLQIPVYVLIRSRAGGFYYSPEELQTMEAQIKAVAEMQFPGVVLGCLDAQQKIDQDATTRLMEAAGYMDVTFHRAFDLVPDPLEALDTLRDLGIQRILTSGGSSTALEGKEVLIELVDEAEEEVVIMPGGNIRSGNLRSLIDTGAKEYHSACMGRGEIVTDAAMVAEMISILKSGV